MIENFKDQIIALDEESLQRLRNGEAVLASQLFRHRDLLLAVRTAPVIGKGDLIKTLQYIHFTNGHVLVHVSDPQYQEDFLLLASIESLAPGQITCRWPEAAFPIPGDSRLLHIIITDGLSLILFSIRIKALHRNGFTAVMPGEGHLLGKRKVLRHTSRGIKVVLNQNAFLACGELIDFSPLAFRVRLIPGVNNSFIWLNEKIPCMISLEDQQRILFSGSCRCIRQTGHLSEKELVLVPGEQGIQRFEKKKMRNPRLQVIPPPSAHFEHPLSKRPIQRDICNLTFAGFAVEEKIAEGVLMPGMIIPNLEIRYAGALKMTCDAQVIYRRAMGKDRVNCGLAILDMGFRAYRHLSHIMVHAGDPQARFSSGMDMDALWEFFFDTGFIYPTKYHILQSSREELKETYRKLYQEDQEIEAHFTCEKNGRIYGHVAIFRAYQRAWMVHHLAARPLNGKRTGLVVLKNVLRFFDGLYRYPSIRIEHMMFYFRPQNHFPNFFFGGFARDFGNPRACSLDLFAYMTHPTGGPQEPLTQGWQLTDFESRHLPELERFYRNTSGGLLLDVLRLGRSNEGEEPLEEVYKRHGFLRQWRVYALCQEQALKAVLVVNHSSPGLNMSELLNSIKIIVTDPAALPWDVLRAVLSRLTREYQTKRIPLMIYPATYPSEQGLKVVKQYFLWILDTQYGKDYLDYMEKKTKITIRFLLKYLLRKVVRK